MIEEPVQSITYVMFLIFTGTALLSTLALFTRQSLLVAYIVLGAIFGPWSLNLVGTSQVVEQAGNIGIIFLLFLLGLDLQPQNLFHSLRKMSLITAISSLLFFMIGFFISYGFGFTLYECLIVGTAAMFSSTIIGIKLLPTTVLHHQHTGELVISILLLQDIVAILTLLGLELIHSSSASFTKISLILSGFPVLIMMAFVFQRFILSKLLERFDRIHEYIFILSIGWCLCMAEVAHHMGLSEEIGAFIAGITIASNPIASYIADSLKPLRDFFLVIFFFAIGASFNFEYLHEAAIPALILASVMLVAKPLAYRWLLVRAGEVNKVSWEIGVRLGQMSEFSLLITYMAAKSGLLSATATYTLQAAVIITFVVSCYWTVLRYPTPLAATDNLRRD